MNCFQMHMKLPGQPFDLANVNGAHSLLASWNLASFFLSVWALLLIPESVAKDTKCSKEHKTNRYYT